jgi:hypothetical protein
MFLCTWAYGLIGKVEMCVQFHIINTVHLHESNETKLNQLMHELSHLYCSVLIMPLTYVSSCP